MDGNPQYKVEQSVDGGPFGICRWGLKGKGNTTLPAEMLRFVEERLLSWTGSPLSVETEEE